MFGGDYMRNVSQLQSLIARAVDPYKHEPDYAAHLEVAEYINKKKANTPREAAMTVVRIVNNRNPHVSMHALALLETLVQSCGYPFHLQVSTKEFLNELVRRFPERPPPFPGPVMSKILELIHTWKETICTDSRYKEDLGNIRDMHRLLTFKGYRFRDIPRPPSSVASTSNLKSAEELEEEDREAQSAKLQELIRRGTPRDLAAAQELMKQLAGAEPDKKPDYRSQSLTELNKLEQKVILLNEMLDNVDAQRGERFASGDVYDQVGSILASARPKIQKWISDAESNDPEMLNIFLQMNDQINSVLNRYEAFKKGDYAAAANPVPLELAGNSRNQETSLIDLEESSAAGNAAATSSKPADDLADIFASSTTSSSPPHQPQPRTQPLTADALAELFKTSRTSSFSPPIPSQQHQQHQQQPSSSSSHGFGSIMLPSTPQPQSSVIQPQQQQQQQQQPNLFSMPAQASAIPSASQVGWAFGTGIGSQSSPSSGSLFMAAATASTPPAHQPQAPAATTTVTASNTQGKDPFADLAGLF